MEEGTRDIPRGTGDDTGSSAVGGSTTTLDGFAARMDRIKTQLKNLLNILVKKPGTPGKGYEEGRQECHCLSRCQSCRKECLNRT